jgi:hypothetical protein
LSQKGSRLLKVAFVGVVILLLLVSVGAASYNNSANSALATKDLEILKLRALLLTENASLLIMQLNALRLNADLSTLSQKVATLQNQSALLRMELSVAQQAGKFQVVAYIANKSVLLSVGTTLEVTSQVPGHNGTLVFLSPGRCPTSGSMVQSTSPQYLLYILVDSRAKPSQSGFYTVSGQSFSLFLENVGPSIVLCKFSLLYVERQ